MDGNNLISIIGDQEKIIVPEDANKKPEVTEQTKEENTTDNKTQHITDSSNVKTGDSTNVLRYALIPIIVAFGIITSKKDKKFNK